MRELEAVKQEALMLQDQMKTIKYDIQKVVHVPELLLLLLLHPFNSSFP